MLKLEIDLSEKELKLLKSAILSVGAMVSSLNFDGTEELLDIYNKLVEASEKFK